MKAIHNYLLWEYTSACVVLSDTKIQIWKQFTTVQAQPNTDILLYYLIQRYKFESNSQLSRNSQQNSLVVLSDTKIQIWKQFTTIIQVRWNGSGCIIWYKDTNLKAIHNLKRVACIEYNVVLSDTKIQIWKQFTTRQRGVWTHQCCIIWYKDTNLKAIHNRRAYILTHLIVVLSDTKIQIWKQFTTISAMYDKVVQLYYLIQRYKFESNSQRHNAPAPR